MESLVYEKQAPLYSLLPKRPGVYFFKNIQSEILYIGKATSLYDRVKSYFKDGDTRPNVQQMIKYIVSVDYVETKTEKEALLLEATLIQTHKPPYNVLIKEGNPFLYLYLEKKRNMLPVLRISRQEKRGVCIGPFLDKKSVRSTYEFIMREFQLRICGKKIQNGCLAYHIDQCAGSCKPDFCESEYQTRLSLACALLEDKRSHFVSIIDETIKESIGELAFERAAHFAYYKEHAERFFQTVAAHTVFDRTKSALFAVVHTPPRFDTAYDAIESNLQKLCNVQTQIRTVDCFDISHVQGRYMVGSAIRFLCGKAQPNAFRRFRIKTVSGQNDYAALAEIVSRRYASGHYPDLVLIDGGKGQKSTIDQLDLPVPVISLAKREERLFTNAHPDGVLLSSHDDTGRMLCALRDYAHHFAVSYHQKIKTGSL